MANEQARESTRGPIGDDFEAGLKDLERIVREMEASDITLERSMELFEQGMVLTEKCRNQLRDAETRVEIIMKKDGKFQAEPFRPSK